MEKVEDIFTKAIIPRQVNHKVAAETYNGG